MFGDQARLTLAGWDEKASLAVAADPKTSAEVLGYFVSPENLRVSLLPALAENPVVNEEALGALAVSGSRAVVETLWASAKVMHSPRLLHALQLNPNMRPNEIGEIASKLAALETRRAGDRSAAEAVVPEEVIEGAVAKYLEENATELAAEADKPFHPLGIGHEEMATKQRLRFRQKALRPVPW